MIRGRIEYVRSPEVTAKAFKPAVVEANAAAVLAWDQRFMPIHFTNEAKSKYSYQARKAKYLIGKSKRFGHNRPLVYTGRSEQAAKSAFRITASANQAKGVFVSLPKYFYFFKSGTPNKAEELIAINESEIQDLAKVHEKTVADYLENIKTATSA